MTQFRRFLTFLSGPKLFSFLLLWLMVLLVAGTIAQKDMGLFLAQEKYFSSWIVWWGVVPAPGGAASMVLMTLSLSLKILMDKNIGRKLGTFITHGGILVLLIGGFITAIFSQEGTMLLKEGESKNYMVDVTQGIMPPPRIVLPFSLKLVEFERHVYPGTDQAKAFISNVIVQDSDVEWPVVIKMNHPLRYKGYTFYQSSFENQADGDVSILEVVKNPGRLFPYIASTILCLGLLLHLCLRLPQLMGRRS